ncbi:uncharacterized protein [Paramormyrops kingsleyae]|uniref:Uncharacterized LOC111854852 n=1 Tax=Paramormyrops kingsleyae TaxID=1676925 RepID=A0A3B3QV51_9TELE|nr:uncharacterized protein LOC111854852 [Paramormyrops kingsleyae]XP_023689074.1 uncharacterized protein LOC111854852 [Paramormyrops kingsleyae]XP_023689075.1 uncharacterized protein LOC111854852 [Paramormyrops kingsleyae]XP_023689076.1 uncharacterized protein LOC111854852 [Paramormyrops kingsleyae]XP_023689077.1 uncharacterized protein LOC111854852 [Paramormyrops kingsleyae]
MLGIHETGDNGSLPSRTYRCMACSATFPGLSSLLVHQASHANNTNSPDGNQAPPALQVSCNNCRSMFSNKDLLDKHHCSAPPISASSSIYICGCGNKFQDFNVMLEHKQLHKTQMDVQEPLAIKEEKAVGESVNSPSHSDPMHASCSESFNLTSHSILSSHVHPPSPQISQSATEDSEVSNKEIFSHAPSPVAELNNMPSVKQVARIPVSNSPELLLAPTITALKDDLTHRSVADVTSVSDSVSPIHSDAVLQNDQQDVKPLKKMLVSAFMERLPPAQAALSANKEEIPKPVGTPSVTASESIEGSSISQLRRLLCKSGTKKKQQLAGNTVSLTKVFLPVVALETRRKLVGVSENGQEGRHQCGLCRRIFHDIDSLIFHHATHKKEKIRGCRHCKRLLISKTCMQIHHLCEPEPTGILQDPFSVGDVMPLSSGNVAVHGQKGTMESNSEKQLQKRLFSCHMCQHSYTRLYNLKKHKCHLFSHQHVDNSLPKDKVHMAKGNVRIDIENVVGIGESPMQKNVSVGTEATSLIKTEMTESNSSRGPEVSLGMLAKNPGINLDIWPGSPKSFMPFTSKSVRHNSAELQETKLEGWAASTQEYSVSKHMRQVETEGEVKNIEAEEEKRRWTMPIDESDIDVLVEAEHSNNKEEFVFRKPGLGDGLPFTSSQLNHPIQTSEVDQSHLPSRGMLQHIQNPLSIKAKSHLEIKKRFECLGCGKSFSRRYVLNLHKKKCIPINRSTEDIDSHSDQNTGKSKRIILPSHHQGSFQEPTNQERMLILTPSLGVQVNRTGDNLSSGDSWGIMSLPAVLPRKVTCECGSVFTSSRQLFEHLQMHAQESYICPTCGKNLHSWMSYEAHLHTHKRSVCPKCQQSFSQHSSLVRHLNKNRCKADGIMGNKFLCPSCGVEFLTCSRLKLHMHYCASKPSSKPVVCPVCTHSFSSNKELQKHLITHSHTQAFRCHICQRSYPSLKSLKNHKRKVHRLMFTKNSGGAV